MTLSEIRELRDKLQPYSFEVAGIQVKFPFETDKLCLTVYPSTEERLKQMQAVLEPYRDRFLRIDTEMHVDPSVCYEYLDKIDFFQFKALLVAVLKAEISALSRHPEANPLYAFVVAISPEHHNITTFWNTPARWAAKEAAFAARGRPVPPSAKYNGPDMHEGILQGRNTAWEPLWDGIVRQEKICTDFYTLTQGNELFTNLYENRFRATAVHALREVMPDLEALPRTKDFVAYVQDYTGASDNLFLALETIPEKQLRATMPWLFTSAGA